MALPYQKWCLALDSHVFQPSPAGVLTFCKTRKTLLACAVRTLRIISAPLVRPKRRPYELLEPQVAALATSAQGMKTRNSSAECFQTKETLRCRTPSTHLDWRSCKFKLINRIYEYDMSRYGTDGREIWWMSINAMKYHVPGSMNLRVQFRNRLWS